MMNKYEAKRLETQIVWNGKVWVCKHCGGTPERFYIVTGHDHTDDEIDWCPCREVSETDRLRAELSKKEHQLAASQAENLRLRDAVALLRKFVGDPANFDCYGTEEELSAFLQRVRRDEESAIACADESLSAPPGDQSALREVIALVLAEVEHRRWATKLAIDQLRSGEWTPKVLK